MTSALGKWLHHVKRVRLPACRVRPQRRFTIVTGNESCGTSPKRHFNKDLDSASSAIATAYFSSLMSSHISLYIPLLAIPRADIPLRPELLHLFAQTGIDVDDICTLDDITPFDPDRTNLFLVDHNLPRGKVGETYDFKNNPQRKAQVEGIIDHHGDEGIFVNIHETMKRYDIRQSGSCASLVTLWLMESEPSYPLSGEQGHDLARLLLSAILVDTANLTRNVTTHDPIAAHFLVKFLPEVVFGTFYNDMRAAKLSIQGMTCTDLLRRDYKEFDTTLGKLGISTITRPISFLEQHFSEFEKNVREYVVQRGLKVYVIMTTFGEGDTFKRGGMVITDHSPVIDALKGDKGEKYGFRDGGTGDRQNDGLSCWVYDQGDVNATRKQIAPLVRDIMDDEGRKG